MGALSTVDNTTRLAQRARDTEVNAAALAALEAATERTIRSSLSGSIPSLQLRLAVRWGPLDLAARGPSPSPLGPRGQA